MTSRSIDYVVAVKGATSIHPADAGPRTPARTGKAGRPPTPRYPDPPTSCTDLIVAAGRSAAATLTWRHGTRTGPGNPTAALSSQFTALRVRPANRHIDREADGTLPECWLISEWPTNAISEWPTNAKTPTDYWLSTLPPDTPIPELVRLAKIRWRIEHNYRELKTGLGLDHFEGRTWTGWHHHATLVTAAHLFITTLRLTTQKHLGRPDPLRHTTHSSTRTCHLDRNLPALPPQIPNLTKYY